MGVRPARRAAEEAAARVHGARRVGHRAGWRGRSSGILGPALGPGEWSGRIGRPGRVVDKGCSGPRAGCWRQASG
eukprot:6152974-Alexandrium_andersonii.AAC.1